jgi:hypothetical protein
LQLLRRRGEREDKDKAEKYLAEKLSPRQVGLYFSVGHFSALSSTHCG